MTAWLEVTVEPNKQVLRGTSAQAACAQRSAAQRSDALRTFRLTKQFSCDRPTARLHRFTVSFNVPGRTA